MKEQPGPETDPAENATGNVLGKGPKIRNPLRQVDAEVATVEARHALAAGLCVEHRHALARPDGQLERPNEIATAERDQMSPGDAILLDERQVPLLRHAGEDVAERADRARDDRGRARGRGAAEKLDFALRRGILGPHGLEIGPRRIEAQPRGRFADVELGFVDRDEVGRLEEGQRTLPTGGEQTLSEMSK